ncbi:MAG: hypothetical protein JO116_02940 [Planctomycetaceae bacterium]|nr:hypothetical protein [Planctomycetaceae bacterium]
MEHREAAGMASAEARPRDSDLDPDHVRWFARYRTPPIIHWLTPPRLVPILLAVAVAVSALVVVGTQALRSAVRWLEGRPPYRVGFREIVLVPPPPAWYRGGSARFLDRVLANSPGRGEMLSVLDEDLGALANDFKLYSWVARVVRVRRSYHRFEVALEYRVPVAWAEFEELREIVLDREGVILPREDFDWEAAGRLVKVCGLKPPQDPRPGIAWKMGDAAGGLEQADHRVLAASRLAAFLKPMADRDQREVPALRFVAVHPAVHPSTPNWWWVQLGDEVTGDELMILWGEPPGAEAPGELSAEAKWAMFRDWARRNTPQLVKRPNYLRFSKAGIAVARVGESAGPRRIASGGNRLGLSH